MAGDHLNGWRPLVRQVWEHTLMRRRPMVGLPKQQLSWLGFDLENFAQALRRRGIATFSYGGDDPASRSLPEWSPVWDDALRYAVAIECESVDHQVVDANPTVAESWRDRITRTAGAVHAVLDKTKPDLVLLVQGYDPVNAIARSWAITNGARLLAIENTALQTRVVWDDVSGITTNRNLAANHFWRYEGNVTEGEEARFRAQVLDKVRSLKSDQHAAPRVQASLGSSKPHVLFLAQVYTDSSLVFGLADWPDPVCLIGALAEWCRQRDYGLVIKLHPKELGGADPILGRPYRQLTLRKMKGAPTLMEELATDQVLIDSENAFDTYDLIDQSAFVVTINSQGGLEAAMRGKAVVVCGRCFYSGLGFTLDAPSPHLLPIQLDKAVEGVDLTTAVKFGVVFYEKYCVEKSESGVAQLISDKLRVRT